MMLFELITLFLALVFCMPLWVLAIELLIALFHKIPVLFDVETAEFEGTYKILMPAHNEADIIKQSLSGLLQQAVAPGSIILVADNCTDATAEIARGFGVTVIERFNDQQRGKGFALDYGLTYLKNHDHPEVLIVLDADCEIDSSSLGRLIAKCLQTSQPVQALYLMHQYANLSLKRRVAGFAWLVKNKLRPLAMNKLGFPVTLTGTGMAFPWWVFSEINVAHGNIVEDMQLGIDCTLKGFAPVFCEQAVVYSDFPEQFESEQTQRTRWEHGHLMTIIGQTPRLIQQAIIRRNLKLLALALDIAVPPLALLVLISLGAIGFISVLYLKTNVLLPLWMLLGSFVLFILTIIAAWWREGRALLSFADLCAVPVYIVSKLSVYFSFIVRRQKDWVRTGRDSGDH